MQKSWLNRPYYSIGDYYRARFQTRVYKASVTVADTCPNRLGLKGMQTCTFCDVWGSAAYEDQTSFSLEQQIKNVQEKLSQFRDYDKYLVYFQSYTNSFMGVKTLEAMYEEALGFSNVVGIVVGTRPDCLSPALLKLWKSLSEKTYISIEFGAQSFYQDFLEFEKRGHSAQQTLDAIYKIADLGGIDIGLHMIFGHPHETVDHAIAQAQFISQLPIQNVKLHNLHVLKNTTLEKYYERKLFTPMDLETYASLVAEFIRHLPSHIPVQRLSSLASRWDELISPDWTRHKKRVFQYMIEFMQKRDFYHGELYTPPLSPTSPTTVPEHFHAPIFDQTPFDACNQEVVQKSPPLG